MIYLDDEDFSFPDDFEEEEEYEIGTCMWGSGAYGKAGTIHIAKPSPDQPPEECCTFG